MTDLELEPYEELLSEASPENYSQVLELLMEETFAERGCFWLERENRFLYQGDEELRKEFPFSRQAVDAVLEQGRSFISFDTTEDDRFTESGSVMMHKVRSCLCAACHSGDGEVLVLAYFDNSMSSGQFTERDLGLLKDVLALVPGAVPLS